jgi:hypothetical protein
MAVTIPTNMTWQSVGGTRDVVSKKIAMPICLSSNATRLNRHPEHESMNPEEVTFKLAQRDPSTSARDDEPLVAAILTPISECA